MKRKNIVFLLFLLPVFLCAQSNNYNLSLLGHYVYPTNRGALSNIYGYVDSLGNEYALVGLYNGFSIVDVTNPQNPTEVYFHSGPSTKWRDIKTWNKHAYLTSEGGGGLTIFDLSGLPDTSGITVTHFMGVDYPFVAAHKLFIDSSGKAYIYGANYGNGGAIILDLSQDPEVPVELGVYNNFYIHDGYVRHDTMWACMINNGFFTAIDVSNPADPITIGSHSTPGAETHSCWLSQNSQYLFVTDEINGGKLTAYNVSNLSNIFEVGEANPKPDLDVIPHNPYIVGDFAVVSNYSAGVVIYDVSHPETMIEVGHYDTSPNYSGGGFHGCWGVYPYLPSGNIIASDIEGGLYILSPNYKRAAFVHGEVDDLDSGNEISDVQVEVVSDSTKTTTNLLGNYRFGTKDSGNFDLIYSKYGYNSDTVNNIHFYSGLDTMINVQLKKWALGITEMKNEAAIMVYPNPFTDKIHIRLAKGKIQKMEIYDLSGRKMLDKSPINTDKLNLSLKVFSGIYILRIYTGSGKEFDKEIIKIPR